MMVVIYGMTHAFSFIQFRLADQKYSPKATIDDKIIEENSKLKI